MCIYLCAAGELLALVFLLSFLRGLGRFALPELFFQVLEFAGCCSGEPVYRIPEFCFGKLRKFSLF